MRRKLADRSCWKKLVLVVLTYTLFLEMGIAQTAMPEVWLAPLSAKWNNSPGFGAVDYERLFDDDGFGRISDLSVSVFKIYPYFASRAPDDLLKKMANTLKLNGVQLGLEARGITPTWGCGEYAKGDGGEATLPILQRLHRLGAVVDYIALDEPLKHGKAEDLHLCGKAMPETLAGIIASNIASYRSIFPQVKIGLVEPVGSWVSLDVIPNNSSALYLRYVRKELN